MDNPNNEISLFKLHGITGYQSLCYRATEEFRLEQVKLEQEKTLKKSLLDKAASVTTQRQQELCYKALDDFAHSKWSVTMAKALFSIKLREKLARRASHIQSVTEMRDELKPNCLLNTSILWPFADNLVALIMSAILVPAAQPAKSNPLPEIGPVVIYKEDTSAPNTTNRTFKYPSHDQNPKARLPLKEMVFNSIIIPENPLQKCRGRPKKSRLQ